MLQPIPSELTLMGLLLKMVYKSQGSGRPTVTSKMLEPMEELTAISPWPCLATSTEVIRSGTEVPAAKKVRPMTASEMPATLPMVPAHH